MNRLIVACAALFISAPLFAQFEDGFMMPAPQPRNPYKPGTLAVLSDLHWVEYMAKFPKSTLGTYERCGRYLFTYTPKGKEGERKAPMVGFAYPNYAGKIGSTVLRSAERVHVQKTTTEARAETARDADGKEHFNVFLLKEDIKKVIACGKIAVEKNK